jgi:hypothetical protein
MLPNGRWKTATIRPRDLSQTYGMTMGAVIA